MVFAAGNCGDATTDDLINRCSVLDEGEGTVLSPAQGKNVVAVGASESAGVSGKDLDTVSSFSSKGPTIDGRIKPDVLAPGDPNWSAYADPAGDTCGFENQEASLVVVLSFRFGAKGERTRLVLQNQRAVLVVLLSVVCL